MYSIDVAILYFINKTLSNSVFDVFFSYITNVRYWYPIYVIGISFLLYKGKTKGRIAAAAVIIMIVITDQVSANIIKEFIQRIRPCNVFGDLNHPLGKQGTFSFPSNHALNNFAVATFFTFLYKKSAPYLFTIAFLIAVSRVYLGLHYPSDILGGAIIGALAGYLFALLVLSINKKFEEYYGRKITNTLRS